MMMIFDSVLILTTALIYITTFQLTTADEFQTYLIGDLIANDYDKDCAYTLSMYDDWIFGGQLSYIAEHVDTRCEEFTVIVSTDYPDSMDPLRIMFRVEYNDTFNALISYTSNIIVSDRRSLNKSVELCNNCSDVTDTYETSDDILFITFSTRSSENWDIIFTAFHTGWCHSYEYTCSNKRCIFHSLTCNGYNPCSDNSDCDVTPAAMATVALGGFCVLGVLFLTLYVCITSRKMTIWSSRERQPKTFSPAKALQSVQSFTPATVTFLPLQRKWSIK